MVVEVRTDLGQEAARRIAEFDADFKQVYIWFVFDPVPVYEPIPGTNKKRRVDNPNDKIYVFKTSKPPSLPDKEEDLRR